MVDVSQYMTSSDGFKTVIDFRRFKEDTYNALTGRTIKWINFNENKTDYTTGKPLEPDWREFVTEPDPSVQIVNDAGAKYVLRNLDKFYNAHTAMGNIVQNFECAKIAADTSLSIWAHIIANSSVYGCSDEKFSMIEGEFDSTMRSLYLYLTALRDGKLLSFGRETTSANYTQNQAPLQDQGLTLPLIGGRK